MGALKTRSAKRYRCDECGREITAYKKSTSTRRKCAGCGSYHVKPIPTSRVDDTLPPPTGSFSPLVKDIPAKDLPLVSIVIPTHNGKKWLTQVLPSLAALDYSQKKIEVIVVDNASDDGTKQLLKRKFPDVIHLQRKDNHYCKANNEGIRRATGDYVALLNNDTELDPDWLTELVKVMHHNPQVAAVGSKVLLKDGRIHTTGQYEQPNHHWGDRGFQEEDRGQYDSHEEVPSLCGVSVLYRKRAIEAVGLQDERFVAYYEDVDYSLRLRKAGWKLVYAPTSIVHHHYNGTASKLKRLDVPVHRYYTERNRLLLLAKHAPQKVPEAMSTSSFFYVEKDYRILYETLPVVVQMLSESLDQNSLFKTLNSLFENLRKVALYEAEGIRTERLMYERRLKDLEEEWQQNLVKEIKIKEKEWKVDQKKRESEVKKDRKTLEASHLRIQKERESYHKQQEKQWRGDLATKDKKNSELTVKLNLQAHELEQKANEIASLRKSLESQKKEFRLELAVLTQERDKALASHEDMSLALEALRAEIVVAADDKSMLATKLREHEASGSALREEMTATLSAKEALILGLKEEHAAEVLALRQEIAGLSDDKETALTSVREGLVAEMEVERKAQNAIMAEKDGEIAALRDSLEKETQKLRAEFESVIEEKESRLATLQGESDREREKLRRESADALAQKDAALTAVRDRHAEEILRLSEDFKRELGARDEKIDSLRAKLDDQSKETFAKVTTLKEEIARREAEMGRLSMELAVARERPVAKVMDKLRLNIYREGTKEEIIRDLKMQIEAKDRDLHTALSSLDAEYKKFAQLQTEQEQKVKEYLDAEDRVKERHAEVLELRKLIDLHQDEIDRLTNSFHATKATKMSLVDHTTEELTWLPSVSRKQATQPLAHPPAEKPHSVHFSVINRCFFRCVHCDIWKHKDENELSLDEIMLSLGRLKDWLGTDFELHFVGGEPFMRKDMLDILRAAKDLGLRPFLTTNGFRINERIAKEICEIDLAGINVSIDGSEEVHDHIRGIEGSHAKAVKALEFLTKHRKEMHVSASTVVTQKSLQELPDLVEWASTLDLNGITFQALCNDFSSKFEWDWWQKSDLWPKDPAKVDIALDRLKEMKLQGLPVNNSLSQIEHMRHYFRNPGPHPGECRVGLNTMHISQTGDALLCWNMAPIGNALTDDLEEIWENQTATLRRHQIQQCARECFILNCNYMANDKAAQAKAPRQTVKVVR